MSFSLGTIDPINVGSWEGFDYPETAVITQLLGDGASTNNAVIQSTALPFREATIGGVIQDSNDLAALRGYYESKDLIAFTDDDSNNALVRVFDLVVTRIFISVWTYRCRLVAAPA